MRKLAVIGLILASILLSSCDVEDIIEYLGYLGARIEEDSLPVPFIHQEYQLACAGACAQMWSQYNTGTMRTQSDYITVFNNMSGPNMFQKVCNGLVYTGVLGTSWFRGFYYYQKDRFFSYAALSVRANTQPVMPITWTGQTINGQNLYHAWLITGYKFKRNGFYPDRIKVLQCIVNDPFEYDRFSAPLGDLKKEYLEWDNYNILIVGVASPDSFRATANEWYDNFVASGSSYYGGPGKLISEPVVERRKL